MFRFYFCIFISFPLIIYYIVKIRIMMINPDRYSEEYRYGVARNMVRRVMKNSRITTKCYGLENLPSEGGYIITPNHQGKFDALGIIYSHDAPCSIVIDSTTAKVELTHEFVDVLGGIRINREDNRQQIAAIKELAEQVKNGKRFIIFPEGGYTDNKNHLQSFMPGAFKAALWSQVPIVPVALIDSYKPFGEGGYKPVETQVHFLKPLYYENYKDLKTKEIAETVKKNIENKINEICKQ
ncbi:1-acyl-sn-glycerol-3-phosphate acyltransferase [Butyrivibrio sp. ob235]|uniref:lysophospholipid acyltransferase family protein n=1 Tax=Butyrivibrio sp. ob235 TaxID=1761780 RepID=UPI0008B27A4D|nr:lysophospholipid acyltransferase family protein [Butyrivibrio sp. ob235]SEL38012.1 1-acyl-sn-glycerol-3-phosphate acyltransferase [Butyrivibrio sp. ob235]